MLQPFLPLVLRFSKYLDLVNFCLHLFVLKCCCPLFENASSNSLAYLPINTLKIWQASMALSALERSLLASLSTNKACLISTPMSTLQDKGEPMRANVIKACTHDECLENRINVLPRSFDDLCVQACPVPPPPKRNSVKLVDLNKINFTMPKQIHYSLRYTYPILGSICNRYEAWPCSLPELPPKVIGAQLDVNPCKTL